MRHPRLIIPTTVALVLGLALGVACSDDIKSTADAAVDMLAAADLGYDGSASGMQAETVQAALDELDGRVDTLEQNQGSLTESVTAVQQELATHTHEASTATAADIKVDAEAGSESVADALAAMETALAEAAAAREQLATQLQAVEQKNAALEASVANLKEKVNAPATCGNGLLDLGGSCIESNPAAPTTWDFAASTCAKAELRLCRPEEYLLACDKGVETEAPEWTSDLSDAVSPLVYSAPPGSPGCSTKGDVSVEDDVSTVHPVRCCRDK